MLIKKNSLIQFTFCFCIISHCLLLTKHSDAQDLYAFTKAGSEMQVFLIWSHDSAALGYNIYRKSPNDAEYPITPINSTPIRPITDCEVFKSIIPVGSDDWNMIAAIFADTNQLLKKERKFEKKGNFGNNENFDVCSITSFPQGSEKWISTVILASVRPSVARIMGLAFKDINVINGKSYSYQIRRTGKLGGELPLVGNNEVTIIAGKSGNIPMAENVKVVNGDAMIQILWNQTPLLFSSFNVYRSASTTGPFEKVNEAEMSGNITVDIDSNVYRPAVNGFTDYERWDSNGYPMTRVVAGNSIIGPKNGVTYYYKIKLKDILGNEGPSSNTVSGIAEDKTPPATPQGIIVIPDESTSSFLIKWPIVKYDIKGRIEKMEKYRVYRYNSAENPSIGAILIPDDVAHPSIDTLLFKIDKEPGLRIDCKSATYYYRVEAIDEAGNTSVRSTAVSGSLKDTTKPQSPKGTLAEGFEDHIKVKWQLHEECDNNLYLIYRAYCNYGNWSPCNTYDSIPNTINNPDSSNSHKPNTSFKPIIQRDCGSPFVLIGSLTYSEAKVRAVDNLTYFDDYTVPVGSPICYAYLVKAQDLSQNISGSFPLPDLPDEIVVCQRLVDRTPPEPAIISGLYALDSAIKIEYIGPPIQDIAAYHVYRSENGENGNYNWVGGITIELPPNEGIELNSPYEPPSTVGCNLIPLGSNEYMSAGVFIDRNVEAKKIYWYKVLGIDKSGNQSKIEDAVAISTFTFASGREAAPEIINVSSTNEPCALTVSWSPAFDPNSMIGFVLFRSNNETGPYYQIGNVIKGNTFTNNSIARNKKYWFRLALLKNDGSLSNLSQPKFGIQP